MPQGIPAWLCSAAWCEVQISIKNPPVVKWDFAMSQVNLWLKKRKHTHLARKGFLLLWGGLLTCQLLEERIGGHLKRILSKKCQEKLSTTRILKGDHLKGHYCFQISNSFWGTATSQLPVIGSLPTPPTTSSPTPTPSSPTWRAQMPSWTDTLQVEHHHNDRHHHIIISTSTDVELDTPPPRGTTP